MIHHVFANKSNIGDWLAARAIQRLLAPAPAVEHLCDEPFVTETLQRLFSLGQDDFIVIGGGGLFMDYFTPFWDGFRRIGERVLYCLWGVGYCDLKREPSRPNDSLLHEIVAGSRFCVVRDKLTSTYLGGIDLPEPVPCPSLCVIKPPAEQGWGVLHVDNYTTAGADVYDAMELHGAVFAKATGRPFRKTNNRIRPESEADLAEVLNRYAASDVILTSALHGCLIGMAMGRKVLAVSGDWKLESLMEAAGLGRWVVGQEKVEMVPDLLRQLQHQPSAAGFVDAARQANLAVAEKLQRQLHLTM